MESGREGPVQSSSERVSARGLDQSTRLHADAEQQKGTVVLQALHLDWIAASRQSSALCRLQHSLLCSVGPLRTVSANPAQPPRLRRVVR